MLGGTGNIVFMPPFPKVRPLGRYALSEGMPLERYALSECNDKHPKKSHVAKKSYIKKGRRRNPLRVLLQRLPTGATLTMEAEATIAMEKRKFRRYVTKLWEAGVARVQPGRIDLTRFRDA
eukprot:TRINITY_DN10373_c0_g2_i2.p1 TRINITY_DN10373_c0_g2~~TRINITY_DN10373_c0_g2_i2.p1  ORF type:complete len:121 (-),score=15.13 TRINITY_DN10373_c0_g2_i2:334-696(-)